MDNRVLGILLKLQDWFCDNLLLKACIVNIHMGLRVPVEILLQSVAGTFRGTFSVTAAVVEGEEPQHVVWLMW